MDNFNVITFLGLEGLNQGQIEKLRPAIERDLSAYIGSRLISELNDKEVEEINEQVKKSKDFGELLGLISRIKPDFEKRKLVYLEAYKMGFKLQKFIETLK